MRILMLLSNPFRPDPRVLKEGLTLTSSGHHVSIIAWDRDGGYGREEDVSGIEVRRLDIMGRYDDFFFMLVTLPLFYLFAFRALMKMRFDVIHCHDFDTLPLGILTARLRGTKVIYDSHESYCDMISGSVPGVLVSLLSRVERCLVRSADAVVCVTQAIEKVFRSFGARRTEVISNCADLASMPSEEKVSTLRASIRKGDETVLLYIGVFERIRGLVGMVQAFRKYAGEEFRFLVGGFGPLEKEVKEACQGVGSVTFIGPVPHDMVLLYTLSSDVLIITADPKNANAQLSVNNKVFEAMAAGKPIIVSKRTANAEIIEEEGCGVAIEYGRAEEIFEVLRRLRYDRAYYEMLSANGLRAARSKYNWEAMGARLISLYEGITSSEHQSRVSKG
ncbi:MAG: glycosyltransferase family 4 protein [Candidatus Thermoplasmatota archaeon]